MHEFQSKKVEGVGTRPPVEKSGGRRSPRPRPTTPLVEPTCQFGRTATRSGQNGRRHNRFAAIGQRTKLVLELGLRATITNNVRYRGHVHDWRFPGAGVREGQMSNIRDYNVGRISPRYHVDRRQPAEVQSSGMEADAIHRQRSKLE